MAIRHRAVQEEDKQERHQAILDAAARLLAQSPERMASVAEVADEAGLAKGTVYLYFASKEELLLALHERNVATFFAAMTERLDGPEPVTLDFVLALTRRHMVEDPVYLPLATRCFGLMATQMPADAAAAFMERMSQRLVRAGAGLERHFPDLAAGGGVALLRRSYALIIGLWQLSSAHSGRGDVAGVCAAGQFDYASELGRALAALWEGTIGQRRPATLSQPANQEV
jgi:AcrR family transcriptional regulator